MLIISNNANRTSSIVLVWVWVLVRRECNAVLCQHQVVQCLYSRGLIRFHILHMCEMSSLYVLQVCSFKHLWMPRETMDAAEREGLQAPAAWVGLGELPDDLPPDFRTAEFPKYVGSIRIWYFMIFQYILSDAVSFKMMRWWKSRGPAWDYGCERCQLPSITKMMHCSFTCFFVSICLMLALKTVLISPQNYGRVPESHGDQPCFIMEAAFALPCSAGVYWCWDGRAAASQLCWGRC